jgi:hypothetical protein
MAHDQQALELAARSCTRRRGLVTALDHERTLSTNHEEEELACIYKIPVPLQRDLPISCNILWPFYARRADSLARLWLDAGHSLICRRSLLCETDLEELCRNVGALSRHSESEAFTDDDKPLEREDGLLLLRLAVDFVLN